MMVNQNMSSIWTKKQDKSECGIWPQVCRQWRKGSPVKLVVDGEAKKEHESEVQFIIINIPVAGGSGLQSVR